MIAKTSWLLALSLVFATARSFAVTVAVDIKDFQFAPATVTVNLGDTVKWTNKGAFTHTTTSNSGLWDKTLAPGQFFSRAFNTEGAFNFHCSIHPSMTGSVIVRSPEQTRIQTGQDIIKTVLPIQLNLTGKSPSLAYLGSYIVNAQSGCANCHSCPTYKSGRNPYLGQPKQFNASSYLAGGVRVTGGGIVALSANLTPDASGKPAGLTLAVFKDALRKGHDPDVAGALLQVMPWPFFGMMSDRDLNAVYEYLRSVPSLAMPAAQCASPGQ
jgi:plastocyanin